MSGFFVSGQRHPIIRILIKLVLRIMKKGTITLICLFLSLFALAQNDTAFVYTFGGPQNDYCSQIQPTRDGGYIMIGTTNSFGAGNISFYAIKLDSNCHKQWSNTYGGMLNQAGYSVVPTLDKGYAFLGFTDSYGNGGYDVFLVKTDSVGKVQWQKTYGGSDWDFGYSIKQTLDSGYVICGLTYSYGKGNGDVYVVRTDKLGDTLWTRAIGEKGYDVGNCVSLHEDTIYAIAGATTDTATGDTNTYFIEIDNKGIIKKQIRTYGILKNDGMNSIRGTTDNGFVMYGFTDSIPDSVTRTQSSEMMLKTDSTGKLQWMRIYNLQGDVARGKDAVECANGDFLALGTIKYFGTNQMHIIYLSSGGWFQNALYFEGAGTELGNSIAYHNKRNLAFAGNTTYGAGNIDVYLVRFKYDSIQSSYKLSQHYITDTLGPASITSISAFSPGVKVFPNPVVTTATVLVQGITGEKYLLALYDETGETLVLSTSFNQLGHGLSETKLNRSGLSSGMYFYRIIDKNNASVATGKIVIE
jgi:hypothetical protein